MNELYDWDNSIELQDGYKYNYDNPMPTDMVKAEGKKLFKEFLSSTQPIINSMAQTFEMKKAAQANKKAQIAKTGKLNEDMSSFNLPVLAICAFLLACAAFFISKVCAIELMIGWVLDKNSLNNFLPSALTMSVGIGLS